MQPLKTNLALYLRTHQYVDSVSYSSRRVISASGWIGASVLVQLLLLQLHTNLLQQLEEKKKKRERELAILNGLHKNHTFRLLLDYSNSFFVLDVNSLCRSDFKHLSLSITLFFDLWLKEDVLIMSVCYIQQLNMLLGAPCNLSIDIRHNLL